MTDRQHVLFLCTGNSCRSQMAEGLARHHWGDAIAVSSAGIEKHGLNPLAVRAMREIGIDISAHTSKTVSDLGEQLPTVVVSVCGHANETCPVFPGSVTRLHAGFDDPPRLAAGAKTDAEAMPHYRRVRDQIAVFVKALPDRLPT